MNLRSLALILLAVGLVGCTFEVANPPPPPPGAVAEPPPAYVEEGAVVNGVMVAAPADIDSYVQIGGGWFYWSPGFHCWVHAHRPEGWHPREGVHVYHHWGEHPMYHRR
jgi:hypothetical protein